MPSFGGSLSLKIAIRSPVATAGGSIPSAIGTGGTITGDHRPAAAEQAISSGANRGRDVLAGIVKAFGGTAASEQAQIEGNVELVETLRAAAASNERRAVPCALVLPAGACADEDRWLDEIEWHDIKPGTRRFLDASPDADYPTLVRAAYARFVSYAAAGIAYHF
jgi:hypothetical protein